MFQVVSREVKRKNTNINKEDKDMPEETKEFSLVEIMTAIAEQKTLIEEKFKGVPDLENKYKAEMAALETRIKEMERIMAPNTMSLPGAESLKSKFSWARAMYGVVTQNWEKAPFEKEIFEATRKAAMATNTDGAGYIVPIEYTAELIEMLEARMVLSALNVSKMTNLSAGMIEIPRQIGGATAYWVGENQDIPESELTFGMMTLAPKQVAALVKTSNRLLALSNPSVDAIIKRDIALRLALKIDLAGIRGMGTSTQPRGISNTPGISHVYAGGINGNGGNLNFDILLDMEGALEDANALFGDLQYVWAPCVRRNLLKLKVKQYEDADDGEYIVQPVTPTALKAWLGYNYQSTTQIPTNLTYNNGTDLTEVIFGNWQEVIMAMWGGVQIMASQETSDAFQKVQTWIRIIQDVDIGVRHPESFCLCSDVKKVFSA